MRARAPLFRPRAQRFSITARHRPSFSLIHLPPPPPLPFTGFIFHSSLFVSRTAFFTPTVRQLVLDKVLSERHKETEYGGVNTYIQRGPNMSAVKRPGFQMTLKVENKKRTKSKEKDRERERGAERHGDREQNELYVKLMKFSRSMTRSRNLPAFSEAQVKAIAARLPQTEEELYAVAVRQAAFVPVFHVASHRAFEHALSSSLLSVSVFLFLFLLLLFFSHAPFPCLRLL